MEDRQSLSPDCNALLDELNSWQTVQYLSQLTGVSPLQADHQRRGAGIHAMFPGGWLSTHLDYAVHPSGLERRVNAIVFLDNSNPRYGGGLQLCDPAGEPKTTLYPAAGDTVVWECSDLSYHGVEPLSLESPMRYTAASYYLGHCRPGATRQKALFLPHRGVRFIPESR
jgi:hypothetical protein